MSPTSGWEDTVPDATHPLITIDVSYSVDAISTVDVSVDVKTEEKKIAFAFYLLEVNNKIIAKGLIYSRLPTISATSPLVAFQFVGLLSLPEIR